MKAVIVEKRGDFAVVLCDNGSIIRIKNKNCDIGQVIEMKKSKLNRKLISIMHSLFLRKNRRMFLNILSLVYNLLFQSFNSL